MKCNFRLYVHADNEIVPQKILLDVCLLSPKITYYGIQKRQDAWKCDIGFSIDSIKPFITDYTSLFASAGWDFFFADDDDSFAIWEQKNNPTVKFLFPEVYWAYFDCY